MGTSISFKRPDGKDANGYLANAARGDAPGVVAIQEWPGSGRSTSASRARLRICGDSLLHQMVVRSDRPCETHINA